jgi:hypothetical protein
VAVLVLDTLVVTVVLLLQLAVQAPVAKVIQVICLDSQEINPHNLEILELTDLVIQAVLVLVVQAILPGMAEVEAVQALPDKPLQVTQLLVTVEMDVLTQLVVHLFSTQAEVAAEVTKQLAVVVATVVVAEEIQVPTVTVIQVVEAVHKAMQALQTVVAAQADQQVQA